jgi:signal transduction histidine kinase
MSDTVTERIDQLDHTGPLRLVLRYAGVIAFGYLLFTEGAFSRQLWLAMICGAALISMVAVMLLRQRRTFGRLGLVLTTVMMSCGLAANPWIDFVGTVTYVVGAVILIGQLTVPLRLSIGIVAVLSAGLVAVAAAVGRDWSTTLSAALGVAAVALLGANRRQVRHREAQDRALIARSRELEVRNAELLRQTEMTRQQTARAAALEERGRIARDIHDVLAHSLGGLVVQLDAAEAELTQGGDIVAAASRLRTSRELAVNGLRDARAAVHQLQADQDSSVDTAGSDLVDVVQRVAYGPVGLQLGVVVEVLGEPRPVSGATSDALAAVTREALTNINKHARGGPCTLTVTFGSDRVQLEVVNALPSSGMPSELARTGAGAGLAGLRRRLSGIGGSLRVGPEGRRWLVRAEVPTAPEGERLEGERPEGQRSEGGPA